MKESPMTKNLRAAVESHDDDEMATEGEYPKINAVFPELPKYDIVDKFLIALCIFTVIVTIVDAMLHLYVDAVFDLVALCLISWLTYSLIRM